MPARKFIWARTPVDTIIPASPNPVVLDLLTAFQTLYGAQLIGSTIMRVRGLLSVSADSGTTATTVVAGIRVATDVRSATNELGPLQDPHADWMAVFPSVLRSAAVGATFGGHQYEVDVKSSRKLEELGQGLILLASQGEAATKNLIGFLSIGIKLP